MDKEEMEAWESLEGWDDFYSTKKEKAQAKVKNKKKMYKSLISSYLRLNEEVFVTPIVVYDINSNTFMAAEKDYMDPLSYFEVGEVDLAEDYGERSLEQAKNFARRNFIPFVAIVEEKLERFLGAIKIYKELELEVSEDK